MKNEECDKKEKNSEAIAQQIQKKFIDERKIFFFGEVNDESCAEAVKKLLYLDMMDKKAEITIYLSTPGGSINAGMALYDTIKLISAPVKIVVTGIGERYQLECGIFDVFGHTWTSGNGCGGGKFVCRRSEEFWYDTLLWRGKRRRNSLGQYYRGK